jgi:hypothetical protein
MSPTPHPLSLRRRLPKVIFATAALAVSCTASEPTHSRHASAEEQRAVFAEIRESHIAANVPDTRSFDRLLRRDLVAYFDGATVTFDLLRREPTQVGVGLPKFSVWVRAQMPGKVVEGAARVAAAERERFDVVQFLTIQDIRADPTRVEKIFPRDVSAEICRRAGVDGSDNQQ